MKGRKLKILWLSIGVLAVIICSTIAFAIFNEEDTTHVNDDDIENSTLIIGTHLIHISALNDSLYDIAQESAQSSGQNEMYYKSELADGKWFEISAATGLSDIMDEGSAVDKSVIEALNLRYYTKSDGITYDLMDGNAVCIFDIINPYDILELTELDAIATYYELLEEKETQADTDTRNMELIESALSAELGEQLKNEDIDKKLEALQKYYEKAAALGKNTADTSLTIMDGLDSARRLEVYSNLYDETLQSLIEDIQTDKEGTDGFYVDYDLIAAIGTAMEEVNNKLIECEAEAVEEGTTAVSKIKYQMIEQVSELIETNDDEAIDSLMENIEDIINIESGIAKNPEREAELIKEVIISEALDKLINEDSDGGVWEIEYLAKAALSGMSAEEGTEFIDEIIEKLDELADGGTGEEVKDELEALKDSFLDMKNKLSGDTSYLAELIDKKEELKTNRQSSLDENNLSEADKIQLELEAIDEEIEKEEQRLTEIINSETAGSEEKAGAMAALQSETAAASIIETKENIQEYLDDGMYDDTMLGIEAMEAFLEMNVPLTLSCMEEIYDDVLTKMYLEGNDDSGLKEVKEALENIIADNYQAIADGLSEETALEILENVIGAAYKDCTEWQKICMVAALYKYGSETNNSDVKTTASNLTTALYSEGNKYIYLKLNNEVRPFVSLKAFSDCSEYRYVFYSQSKSVTLTKGAKYYTYTVFKNQVISMEGIAEMDTYARYQSDIYLSDTYMEEVFMVSCIYVDNTDYAILITQDMEEELSILLDALYSRTN